MPLTQRIAFIGAGNMASALIEGLLAAGTSAPERLTATDPRPEARDALRDKHGIAVTPDNLAVAREADVVVLAVKPQAFGQVLSQLAGATGPDTLAVSIAAGVPISVIEGGLAAGTRVVRAMPNTPSLVGAGATAIAAGSHASDPDMDVTAAIFESVGIVERVDETLLDAVTGLSGSGPAYVFAMIEAMTAAGVKVGLPETTAAALAAQTVYGAGKLLRETGESPEALRRKVTSPGGTTQAGLERLGDRGFADVIADAVGRATERARELGREAAKKG
ncbi:MAG: pyrroline-5-carboxylate reductase [Myxococcales bacterium]|jgi:pyrroline-5-carboxylate reductase